MIKCIKYLKPEAIRSIRKLCDLSREDLGNICDLTRQTIANIEHGKKTKTYTLIAITMVLSAYVVIILDDDSPERMAAMSLLANEANYGDS